ncbi:hypothetical protein KEM54_004880, partial [Ascosphaera aggregata]
MDDHSLRYINLTDSSFSSCASSRPDAAFPASAVDDVAAAAAAAAAVVVVAAAATAAAATDNSIEDV